MGAKPEGLLPRTYKMQWREDFSTQSKHFSEFVNFYKRGKDEGKTLSKNLVSEQSQCDVQMFYIFRSS